MHWNTPLHDVDGSRDDAFTSCYWAKAYKEVVDEHRKQGSEYRYCTAEVSSTSGRDAGSTNMVLGANDSEAKWRELDEKVCSVFALLNKRCQPVGLLHAHLLVFMHLC